MDAERLIYLVEDDQRLGEKLHSLLNSSFPDFKTHRFVSSKDFEIAFSTKRPTMVIFSLEIESGNMFEECLKLKTNFLDSHVDYIIIGNRGSIEEFQEQIVLAQFEVVPKPIRTQVLLETVENCFNRSALRDIRIFSLKKGEFLFKQGEESTGLYVLRKGKVAIRVEKEGKSLTLKELDTPQMLGEMAFIDGSLRSASIEILENSEFIELDVSDFKEYMQKQPVWVKLLIDTLVKRLREMDELYLELLNRG